MENNKELIKKQIVTELQKLAEQFAQKAVELNLTEAFEEGISPKQNTKGVILNSELGVSFQGDSKDDIKLVIVSMRIGSVIHKTKHFGYNKTEPEWEDL